VRSSVRALGDVSERLADPAPLVAEGEFRARTAVALVLRERAGDLELLMIRRALNEGDQWSGQIAFPGGRLDPGDAGPEAAAVRETLEEVGVDLAAATRLGRLDDLLGTVQSIVVSAFVYGVKGDPPLTPNYEVAEAFWLPLSECTNPARHIEDDFDYLGNLLHLPGLRASDAPEAPALWGLSYRFLEILMERLGRPIPTMPWDDGG